MKKLNFVGIKPILNFDDIPKPKKERRCLKIIAYIPSR